MWMKLIMNVVVCGVWCCVVVLYSVVLCKRVLVTESKNLKCDENVVSVGDRNDDGTYNDTDTLLTHTRMPY